MCQEKTHTHAEDTETESEVTEEELEREEEEEEEEPYIIRAKWSLDGCATIDEIIERLKQQIEEYKQLKEEGWELKEKIDDDYGFLSKKVQAIRVTEDPL